ncbi:hypothetical protein [Neisseria chenwenguii]|uniref:hypothetical protein n=1 Tax=Neisseria chenwenguii TaxID=1853278 RepID=UPI0012FD79E2|nr:hypothetical protein [Neisseria chenwenguii]
MMKPKFKAHLPTAVGLPAAILAAAAGCASFKTEGDVRFQSDNPQTSATASAQP